jgi:hypothetical protein
VCQHLSRGTGANKPLIFFVEKKNPSDPHRFSTILFIREGRDIAASIASC